MKHKKENLKTDLSIRKRNNISTYINFFYILNMCYLSNFIKVFMVTRH